MQMHLDTRTQSMHRHGASKVLQSLQAGAIRFSSPRLSVVAAAITHSSPASHGSLPVASSSIPCCSTHRAVGLLHHSMQQLLLHAHALGGGFKSTSTSSLRSSVVTAAGMRPRAPSRRLVDGSGAGCSSSGSGAGSSSSGSSTIARESLQAAHYQPSNNSSSSAAAAVQPAQPSYQEEQQQVTKSSRSSSSHSSGGGASYAHAASLALDKQHLAAVEQYLQQLNEEQRLAAYSREQHVRVIAGPGSGKTRVIAARVARLVASGAAPESLLVITFTRKAAGELLQRLEVLLGPGVTRRLRPSTFHSLCSNLLRENRQRTSVPDFQVANEDDAAAMVKSILDNKSFRQTMRYKQHEEPAKTTSDEVTYYRKHISGIKNFCVNIAGRSGTQLISEMVTAGRVMPGGNRADVTARIAAVYDEYVARMAREQLLDFDDLLHQCLALLINSPTVKAAAHDRWRHVLVDESQDTNLCQFELVRQLTSPSSNLFMVGDPDQGIYGFRGAQTSLLAQHFSVLYGRTASTRALSENYRSREPIVEVAEFVRRHGRLSGDIAAAGRSRRPHEGVDAVTLMEAENQLDEVDQVVEQLRSWHKAGYAWGEMAVLSRTKQHVQGVHRAAISAGIPSHLWSQREFFEAAEVTTALALLRCLVDPRRAGECIRKRLVQKSSSLKVPLMAGLGVDSLTSLAAALESAADSSSSSSSSNNLGNCLLGDLLYDVDPQQALALCQAYAAATAAGTAATQALQGLAAAWRLPAGAKKPTQKQRGAVDRLRGLVLLGRAAAVTLPPDAVLQLLLEASGVLPELQAALQEERPNSKEEAEKRRLLQKRIDNLTTLVKLARNTEAYNQSPLLGLDPVKPATGYDWGGGSESDGDVSSSFGHLPELASSVSSNSSNQPPLPQPQPATGLPLLQKLYDFCVLQGEDDEDADVAERVQLMTMHASKGKEYACVAVLRVHDGSIPSIRRDEPGGQFAALEQERNLLYVAITRAKEHCFLVWPKCTANYAAKGRRYGTQQSEDHVVSRFLKPVLAAAAQGRLPGVRRVTRQYIQRN